MKKAHFSDLKIIQVEILKAVSAFCEKNSYTIPSRVKTFLENKNRDRLVKEATEYTGIVYDPVRIT